MEKYEIYYHEEGQETPTTECFDSFEEAVERAEDIKAEVIVDDNGNEFMKCAFCEEWVDSREINEVGFCDRCEDYFRSRGEID